MALNLVTTVMGGYSKDSKDEVTSSTDVVTEKFSFAKNVTFFGTNFPMITPILESHKGTLPNMSLAS